jgi:hypothetical protein
MRSRQFLAMMFDVVILCLSFSSPDSRGDPNAPSNPLSSGARRLPVCSSFDLP